RKDSVAGEFFYGHHHRQRRCNPAVLKWTGVAASRDEWHPYAGPVAVLRQASAGSLRSPGSPRQTTSACRGNNRGATAPSGGGTIPTGPCALALITGIR